MVKKFFDKKTGSGISVNEQVGEELHKPVIKKFKRRKVYARFKDNIRTVDLTEMESLSSKNTNVKYLLCVIDVFIKYAWVNPLTFSRPKKKKSICKVMYKDFIRFSSVLTRQKTIYNYIYLESA